MASTMGEGDNYRASTVKLPNRLAMGRVCQVQGFRQFISHALLQFGSSAGGKVSGWSVCFILTMHLLDKPILLILAFP